VLSTLRHIIDVIRVALFTRRVLNLVEGIFLFFFPTKKHWPVLITAISDTINRTIGEAHACACVCNDTTRVINA